MIPTYIGYCCREWILAVGHKGRCGICGQVPSFLRLDEEPAIAHQNAEDYGDQN